MVRTITLRELMAVTIADYIILEKYEDATGRFSEIGVIYVFDELDKYEKYLDCEVAAVYGPQHGDPVEFTDRIHIAVAV